MEVLAIYLTKSSLCVLVFLGIYWCFFRNETFYHFNRYFLLIGLIGSVVLPFYTYFYEVNVITTGRFPQMIQSTKPAGDTVHSWFNVALSAYVIGACILLIRHIAGLRKIKRVINQYGCISENGYKLVNTPVFSTSFSVFNYIIFDGSTEVSETEKKMILEHELAHVKQRHWIDLLASQAFCMVQWFNPFAWLYLYAIRQNHEYLADQAVLKRDNSPAMYRAALINQSLGASAFTFVSPFSHFDKLKRINMMKKPDSGSTKKMAAALALPLLALLFWAFAKPDISVITSNKYSDSQPVKNIPKDELIREKRETTPNKKPDSELVRTRLPQKKRRQVQPTTDIQKPSSPIKSNNLPSLIYLDGVEIKSIDIIAPKDIESIEVLKGKSAIAMYGEKGKNGVILISSKKNN